MRLALTFIILAYFFSCPVGEMLHEQLLVKELDHIVALITRLTGDISHILERADELTIINNSSRLEIVDPDEWKRLVHDINSAIHSGLAINSDAAKLGVLAQDTYIELNAIHDKQLTQMEETEKQVTKLIAEILSIKSQINDVKKRIEEKKADLVELQNKTRTPANKKLRDWLCAFIPTCRAILMPTEYPTNDVASLKLSLKDNKQLLQLLEKLQAAALNQYHGKEIQLSLIKKAHIETYDARNHFYHMYSKVFEIATRSIVLDLDLTSAKAFTDPIEALERANKLGGFIGAIEESLPENAKDIMKKHSSRIKEKMDSIYNKMKKDELGRGK